MIQPFGRNTPTYRQTGQTTIAYSEPLFLQTVVQNILAAKTILFHFRRGSMLKIKHQNSLELFYFNIYGTTALGPIYFKNWISPSLTTDPLTKVVSAIRKLQVKVTTNRYEFHINCLSF